MMLNYFNLNSTALVVIDIQNDMCHQNGFYGRTGRNLQYMQAIIPKVRNLIDGARNAGVKIIFIKSYFDEKYMNSTMKIRKMELGRTEDLLIEGDWGSELIIMPEKGDLTIIKNAYSAFIGTTLEQRLRQEGVESIVVTGVLTNVCCESTIRHGFMLGFNTVLIEDCCASDNLEAHKSSIYNITNYFGWVTNSSTLLDFWLKKRRG